MLTFRRLAKTGIAAAAHWSGATRLPGMLAGSRTVPLILAYHRVVEDFEADARHTVPAMLISHPMLEQHLDWIGRRFRFVSLDELGSRLERGERFDKPVAAITFDDGYRDVYENAFPLLKRKGVPAAVFVVTDLIGTADVQIHDRLYLLLAGALSAGPSGARRLVDRLVGVGVRRPALDTIGRTAQSPTVVARALLDGADQAEIQRVIDVLESEVEIDAGALRGLGSLTWDMLAEMARAGMTIGSHSKTHALLINEGRPKVLEETTSSRRALESRFGRPVDHFAYPTGGFNPGVVDAVAASGYRFGYATCGHRDRRHPLLTLPRKVVWQNTCADAFGRFSADLMSCAVAGIFAFRDPCKTDHGVRNVADG